jgi:hypothetical protein
MKKRDWILAAAILAVAFFLWAFGKLTADEGGYLRIMKEGKVYGTYELSRDREIMIDSGNTCQIRDGVVRMIHADCPDQICVHTAGITVSGGTIVCLPNKVVLEVISKKQGGESDDTPDSISS